MQGKVENGDVQLTKLTDEILTLQDKVASLTNRVATLEGGSVSQSEHSPAKEISGTEKGSHVTKKKVGWTRVGHEVLLPRMAAVSFMMVVALILRTVTDNGMIDRHLGSYVGTIYALFLIGLGWLLYSKSNKLAPVFPACGVFLLYSIIYETNVHFESLSSTTVYSILLVAEIVVVIIGLRCRAVVLLYFATFGSTFVGAAIGYPEPLFACLGVVLIVNNIAGHLAASRKISLSLRWYTLFFSGIFWGLWTYKLNYSLRFGANAQDIGLYWSMPVLFLFFVTYGCFSLWQTKVSAKKIGFFHYLLPILNSGGTFFVVYFIAGVWLGYEEVIGFGAVVLSVIYIAVVAWFANKDGNDIRGGKEYVSAATLLLIQGLSVALPVIWALPIWTAAALALTLLSWRWQSGTVRVISYLFQLFIVINALKSGSYVEGQVALPVGLVVSGLLAGSCLWLYGWCRKNVPASSSVFFKMVDPTDRTAVILLIIGLVHIFSTLKFASYGLLGILMDNPENAFYCSQSIIINMGAVALMIAGFKRRTKEILVLSTLVVLAGALKVFIFDLLQAQGMPLVLSVFSFGVVAVAGSITMKKWQAFHKG